jgi:hypothetical protein
MYQNIGNYFKERVIFGQIKMEYLIVVNINTLVITYSVVKRI